MLGRSPESWWVVPGFANCLALHFAIVGAGPLMAALSPVLAARWRPARRPQPSRSSRDPSPLLLVAAEPTRAPDGPPRPAGPTGEPRQDWVPAVSVLTAWPLVLTCDSDRNTTEFVGGRRLTRLGAGHLEPHARRAGHERVGPAATGGRITAGPRLGCPVGTWKRLLHSIRSVIWPGGTTSGTRVLRPPAAVARPEVLGHQGLRLTPCQTP
jgi:hypothetical protein